MFTMAETCPSCGGEAVNPKPPKFSIEDKVGKYRREAKREQLIKEGLL
jgi:H/ACA ribonucleoprotein complex subunit 3